MRTYVGFTIYKDGALNIFYSLVINKADFPLVQLSHDDYIHSCVSYAISRLRSDFLTIDTAQRCLSNLGQTIRYSTQLYSELFTFIYALVIKKIYLGNQDRPQVYSAFLHLQM